VSAPGCLTRKAWIHGNAASFAPYIELAVCVFQNSRCYSVNAYSEYKRGVCTIRRRGRRRRKCRWWRSGCRAIGNYGSSNHACAACTWRGEHADRSRPQQRGCEPTNPSA